MARPTRRLQTPLREGATASILAEDVAVARKAEAAAVDNLLVDAAEASSSGAATLEMIGAPYVKSA